MDRSTLLAAHFIAFILVGSTYSDGHKGYGYLTLFLFLSLIPHLFIMMHYEERDAARSAKEQLESEERHKAEKAAHYDRIQKKIDGYARRNLDKLNLMLLLALALTLVGCTSAAQGTWQRQDGLALEGQVAQKQEIDRAVCNAEVQKVDALSNAPLNRRQQAWESIMTACMMQRGYHFVKS